MAAIIKYSLEIFVFLALVVSLNTSLADSTLPDIGGPASAELSTSKEIELGKILIAEVRGHLPVMNDPELSQYIHSLGTRIISGGLNSNFPFTFLLVANPDINAFALPGGIVVINTGLLILSQQESEVASVFAHEIAHVTQRHIARKFSDSKSLSLISALTFLGSILAAAYDSELGQAAIFTSQATIQDRQLAYSRSFEQEADRIGMQLLVSANIDPHGMPLFFERLNKHTQLNRGQFPEFLSTHPLTANRISESQTRASQYRGNFTSNTIHFNYARARAIALTQDPADLASYLKKKNKTNGLSETERYSYALALSRTGKNKQAISSLKDIKLTADNELTLKLAIAQVYIVDGQYQQAINMLKPLEEIYPNNLAIVTYLSTALVENDQATYALQKLDRLNYYEQQNPIIHKLTAKASSRANIPWRSHESLGSYYAEHGQYGTAMEQIQLALRSPGIDLNSKQRVEAKKKQLKEQRRKRDEFK